MRVDCSRGRGRRGASRADRRGRSPLASTIRPKWWYSETRNCTCIDWSNGRPIGKNKKEKEKKNWNKLLAPDGEEEVKKRKRKKRQWNIHNTEHVYSLFSDRSPITNCPRWGFNVVLTACRYMERSERDGHKKRRENMTTTTTKTTPQKKY